jgi:microcystin degradation protein MlrC
VPGVVAAMDATGARQPVPILPTMAEPNGPMEEASFAGMMRIWRNALERAAPIDPVDACIET